MFKSIEPHDLKRSLHHKRRHAIGLCSLETLRDQDAVAWQFLLLLLLLLFLLLLLSSLWFWLLSISTSDSSNIFLIATIIAILAPPRGPAALPASSGPAGAQQNGKHPDPRARRQDKQAYILYYSILCLNSIISLMIIILVIIVVYYIIVYYVIFII